MRLMFAKGVADFMDRYGTKVAVFGMVLCASGFIGGISGHNWFALLFFPVMGFTYFVMWAQHTVEKNPIRSVALRSIGYLAVKHAISKDDSHIARLTGDGKPFAVLAVGRELSEAIDGFRRDFDCEDIR